MHQALTLDKNFKAIRLYRSIDFSSENSRSCVMLPFSFYLSKPSIEQP
ncbi:MAG: hypothetical protein ACI8W0_001443 [Flavobacterium sp.]